MPSNHQLFPCSQKAQVRRSICGSEQGAPRWVQTNQQWREASTKGCVGTNGTNSFQRLDCGICNSKSQLLWRKLSSSVSSGCMSTCFHSVLEVILRVGPTCRYVWEMLSPGPGTWHQVTRHLQISPGLSLSVGSGNPSRKPPSWWCWPVSHLAICLSPGQEPLRM